jgi:glycosyltransferase involved in cell wall biosynthesis
MRYAVIIPACNEEECIVPVLRELRSHLPEERFALVVGVNGSTDRTAVLARGLGVLVAETQQRGYGHGCQAAIDHAERMLPDLRAFIFFAADGANSAADIAVLVAEHEAAGTGLVLGCRTTRPENRAEMGVSYFLANRLLGSACRLFCGTSFSDLGPLRLIDRELFRAMDLREWTYGWTIEAQVVAVRLGVRPVEVPVTERRRIAGVQKVSRVSWWRTLAIGGAIIAAGFRSRSRPLQALPGTQRARREGEAEVGLTGTVRQAP